MVETTDTTRWQPIVAHAAAASTVPGQYASLAIGLINLTLVALREAQAPLAVGLALSMLQSALLAGGLWLGLRLRIDAVLFHALAKVDGTDGFDRAMVDLGFLGTDKAARSMPERVAGLVRLIRLLGLVVVAQLALLIATGYLLWR
jgi:hypothetical protein